MSAPFELHGEALRQMQQREKQASCTHEWHRAEPGTDARFACPDCGWEPYWIIENLLTPPVLLRQEYGR